MKRSLLSVFRKTVEYKLSEEKEQETPAEERIRRAKEDYNYYVATYFPNYAQYRCSEYQIRLANEMLADREKHVLLSWHRDSAKSTHANLLLPVWLLMHQEIHLMLLVGNDQYSAIRLLNDLYLNLKYNKLLLNDFPEFSPSFDTHTKKQFSTISGFTCIALGAKQQPRGVRIKERRPDYIVIDDIDNSDYSGKTQKCRNMYNWITKSLIMTRSVQGLRCVIANNKAIPEGLIDYFFKNDTVFEKQMINMLDEQGNPTWPEKFTPKYVEYLRNKYGESVFQSEAMNNPVLEGNLFKPEWIIWKDIARTEYRSLFHSFILYIDPAYSEKGDTMAAKLWAKGYDDRFYLLECFCRKCSIGMLVEWLFQTDAMLRGFNVEAQFIMERQFVMQVFRDEIERQRNNYGFELLIIPDTRTKPNKKMRIESLQVLYERGRIVYNSAIRETQDMQESLRQLFSFSRTSTVNDDSPDADEGALHILLNRNSIRPKIEFGKIENYSTFVY